MTKLTQIIGIILVSWISAGAAIAQPTAPRSRTPAQGTNTGRSTGTALVPASQPDPMLNNGCWVQLMDNIKPPQQREYLTIIGRTYLPDLATASGKSWAGRVDGLSIGPNALVTAYPQKGFEGRGVTLKPNQIIQDLRADLGAVDSIKSMQVECRA